jgi:hypothetical protein
MDYELRPVELFHWFEAVQTVPGLQSVVRPTAQSFLRQDELTLIDVPVKNTIPFYISFDLSFFRNKAVKIKIQETNGL